MSTYRTQNFKYFQNSLVILWDTLFCHLSSKTSFGYEYCQEMARSAFLTIPRPGAYMSYIDASSQEKVQNKCSLSSPIEHVKHVSLPWCVQLGWAYNNTLNVPQGLAIIDSYHMDQLHHSSETQYSERFFWSLICPLLFFKKFLVLWE